MHSLTCVLVVVCVARKLRLCPSYSRRRDRINSVLLRSYYKGAGVHLEQFKTSSFQDYVLQHGIQHRTLEGYIVRCAGGTLIGQGTSLRTEGRRSTHGPKRGWTHVLSCTGVIRSC